MENKMLPLKIKKLQILLTKEIHISIFPKTIQRLINIFLNENLVCLL